ncbi:hypothetical protein [Chryseobacterium sp. T1]
MRKIKGFALLVLAVGLIIPLTIINRDNVDEEYGDTDGYWKDTAKNIDIWANREFRATWNKELKLDGGYEFGAEGETISEALQRNHELGTLSKRGKKLYNIINKIDPGHFDDL